MGKYSLLFMLQCSVICICIGDSRTTVLLLSMAYARKMMMMMMMISDSELLYEDPLLYLELHTDKHFVD